MIHDTWHSLAAELHTRAAYEHWVADYRQKRGESQIAQEFARRAYEHSDEAAELSKEAFRQAPVEVRDHLSAQRLGKGSRERFAEPAERARECVRA
jgi:hypothetical protein